MVDPITITTTIISVATFIKDLIDLGQSIKRSIEKVEENRRQLRDVTSEILHTLESLASLSEGTTVQSPELLVALHNLKRDMLYVLSVAEKLSPTDQHPRRRGFRSQITVWLKREDIEVEIKRLNKAVSKLYIQFTTLSAARIEHISVRIEQSMISQNEETRARLRRLERMIARVAHRPGGRKLDRNSRQWDPGLGNRPIQSEEDQGRGDVRDSKFCLCSSRGGGGRRIPFPLYLQFRNPSSRKRRNDFTGQHWHQDTIEQFTLRSSVVDIRWNFGPSFCLKSYVIEKS
ncbi:hypothetical protein C8J57DRAFT_1356581 [Mycena rebaudengoi]|nr:hypothetical protein C8J57DRAFT_1356581 [Mycena rebaudengoi]